MLEEEGGFRLGVFLGVSGEGAIVENGAVLVNLHERSAAVLRGACHELALHSSVATASRARQSTHGS